MANTITAGNSTNSGTVVASDTTGVLNILTGTGAGTSAVYVDASQNVGIGTTSPSGKLHVQSAGNTYLRIQDTQANGYNAANLYTNDQRTFRVGVLGTVGGFPNGALIVYDETAAQWRMVIDSSGNMLVGTTSAAANERLNITGSVNSYVTRNINSNASPAGVLISYSAASPNLAGNEFIVCSDSSATRMTVRSNGGIVNYQANNVNLSDAREKTNFAPAGDYLSKICAIPVQTFNYIDQNLEEDDGLTLGVIAQDVQAVAPELVTESNFGTEEEPKMRLSIYQTDLQYALMKSIQELKAELDALKAKVGA